MKTLKTIYTTLVIIPFLPVIVAFLLVGKLFKTFQIMEKFTKYKQNLMVRKEYLGAKGWRIIVKSYETDVAWGWEHVGTLVVTKHYSPTTSKHINYVAEQLEMTVKKLY